MKLLQAAVYSFLNRHFPEQAYRFVLPAPDRLQLTADQRQVMDANGIYRIQLEYRPNVRALVARSYWSTGQKDAFLHPALHDVPRDVLLITRDNSGKVGIRAGTGYHNMPEVQFETLVAGLLDETLKSISFFEHLRAAARTDDFGLPTKGSLPGITR